MRFGQKVVAADWSDADNRWTLRVDREGEQREISCAFLLACSGYYNYDEGYSPEFAGSDDFAGTIVHPQHWPEDLDYQGKKIVVIGSGATAVTLIPALIDSGSGHVTMLQRSPTYIARMPDKDPFRRAGEQNCCPRRRPMRRPVGRPSRRAQCSTRSPGGSRSSSRKALRTMGERRLPEGYDFDKHFSPSYKPWDQRVCLAPNGDLFRAIRKGKADVVTDTIERFTKTGIKLASGEELDADIIITATGLNMQLFGGADDQRNGEQMT